MQQGQAFEPKCRRCNKVRAVQCTCNPKSTRCSRRRRTTQHAVRQQQTCGAFRGWGQPHARHFHRRRGPRLHASQPPVSRQLRGGGGLPHAARPVGGGGGGASARRGWAGRHGVPRQGPACWDAGSEMQRSAAQRSTAPALHGICWCSTRPPRHSQPKAFPTHQPKYRQKWNTTGST